MDEFKPEDELKPDASDRRPSRPRKTSSAPKVPVSRQHMMMGIGILVLLLLVLGIGSALNGSDESKPAAANSGSTPSSGSGEKSIDLSGSTTMSGGQSAPADSTAANSSAAGSAATDSSAPRDVSMPPVSSTPTQAAPVDTPASQQRVTLPGDLNSALSNQQQQVDNAAQSGQGGSSLPTAPATVSASANSGSPISAPAASRPAAPRASAPSHATREPAHKSATAARPAASESRTHTTPARPATSGTASGSSAASGRQPTGNYTLQLSGASRAESLNAWAKKQNLSGYHVYKTTRNGQPWYVLVSGSYATSAEAKRAVASLPADVRAQNPWVKPVSQVKKEASQ